MKAKTVFIGVGLFLAGLAYVGWQKIQALKAVFDKMTIRPSGISGISLNLEYFTFKLSFEIHNPTAEAFSVTGASIAKIKRILVYRSGKFLGQATLNLEELDIPAISSIEIKNVPFQVSVQNIVENLSTIQDLKLSDLTIVCIVEVLGKEYVIEN